MANGEALGFKINLGRNNFFASGQIPLDEVAAGQPRPFRFPRPVQRRSHPHRRLRRLLPEGRGGGQHLQDRRLRVALALRSVVELHELRSTTT
ncbi:MAG: hypothetical protein WKF84_27915 [Pyrinomonadaceae bacterium]